MALLRREDQIQVARFPMVDRYTLVGADTGSTQLKVGDLTWMPGADLPTHIHPERLAEETQFIIDGELQAVYDDFHLTVKSGDVLLAPPGVKHGFANRSGQIARMITIFPFTNPSDRFVDEGVVRTGHLPLGVIKRRDLVLTRPWPGVSQLNLVGVEQGAVSTRVVDLRLQPSASIPEHSHVHVETAIFIIEGNVRVSYDGSRDVDLRPGDVLLIEPGLCHELRNVSELEVRLLMIIPAVQPFPCHKDATT